VPGFNGATVIRAGIRTAPPSSQTGTGTQPASSVSAGRKATLGLALGQILTISFPFRVGILRGVDTQGCGTGVKYQGKPWLALTLSAGSL
jgi:hypothetical protein